MSNTVNARQVKPHDLEGGFCPGMARRVGNHISNVRLLHKWTSTLSDYSNPTYQGLVDFNSLERNNDSYDDSQIVANPLFWTCVFDIVINRALNLRRKCRFKHVTINLYSCAPSWAG